MIKATAGFKKIFTALLCATAISGAWAGNDLSKWQWSRSVDAQGETGFVRLKLTDEILDQSNVALTDLRVINESNDFVPHLIHWGRIGTTEQKETRAAKLINATFQEKSFSRVTLDFSEQVEKNRVRVVTSGENYRRRVLVEASTDTLSWETLAENLYVFDVPGKSRSMRLDSLELPSNNFRYLRLTVYNMPDDPRRIEILSADSERVTRSEKSDYVDVPAQIVSRKLDPETRESIIQLDCGARNLPIDQLSFQISDPYFYRGFRLLGRNSTTETVTMQAESGNASRVRDTPWMDVQSGVLYRIKENEKTSEHLRIERAEAPFRFLQMCITNGDNPPLQVERISAMRRDVSVIFAAKAEAKFRLIGGNAEAGAPNYDLADSVRGLSLDKLPLASVGAVTVIAGAVPLGPWSERHAILMWAGLAIIVAGMLILILRGMRQVAAPASGSETKEP